MQKPFYPKKSSPWTNGIRTALLLVFLLFGQSSWGQEELLAKRYMEDGEYAKALAYFEKLSKKNPHRMDFAEATVKCYQQLERFEDAEKEGNLTLLKKYTWEQVKKKFTLEISV